jgi:hypothetical protein
LWVYYEDIETGIPLAIAMTAIVTEPVARMKYLLIYALTAIDKVTTEDYESGLDTLRSFAAGNKCSQILAYVEDSTFVRRLESVGGVKVSNLVRL